MDRHDSFREFVAGHQQALMRTAYLLTGDAHQAEDLLQHVLLKVLGRWSRLSRVEHSEAYARKALVNPHISWRRPRIRTELPTADPPERPYSSEDSTVVRLVMRQALMRLPPRQRAVIVLRYYEDRTERETADLDPGVSQVYLRTWLSEDEVTVLTTSVRCRPASEVPDDEPAVIDLPYRTMTTYAVNVRTGQARRLAEFRAQGVFEVTLPGPPGAL